MEGVGFIETFSVGSGEHKSHTYMFATVYDIKRINITQMHVAT